VNERIRELIRQADFIDTELLSESQTIMLEKFAELIVDEVYDYILNATFDDEPWPDRKDVKKHFGVDE